MSGDPKVRRFVGRNWWEMVLVGFAYMVAGIFYFGPYATGWPVVVTIAPPLLWMALCLYCASRPWLTPEERVAKLEKEADEALAREIAALGDRPRGRMEVDSWVKS